MYSAKKIKTFTPIIHAGTGPTGTNLNDALYDIFNEMNEENVAVNPFSDYRINEMIRDFIQLTGMNDWIDGDYIVFDDYEIKIKHMTESAFEEMHEFNGY